MSLRFPSKWLLAWILLPALCGCLGPMGIYKTRTQYNEAILRTSNEELLLNLVRLRFGESPNFLTVTGVTTQFELDASTGFRAGIERSDIDRYANGQLGFADRPTVTMSPQRSAAFTRALLTHISLETLYLFSTTGYPVDVLLRLFVRDVNGIENAVDGCAEFADFRQVAELMRLLQDQRNIVLGLDNRQGDVPDATPFASLDAEALVKIKQAGYGVRPLGDGKGYVLTRTTPVRVLRVHPDAVLSPEVVRLEQLLRLVPGQALYELEDAPQGQFRPGDMPGPVARVTFTTRSVLEVMRALAQAVSVPDEHLCKGGSPAECDGGQVLGDLFHVAVSKSKPKSAAVAVKYRGHWYFIDDRDAASKFTLHIFSELFRLERIGDPEGAPLLTLPVGR